LNAPGIELSTVLLSGKVQGNKLVSHDVVAGRKVIGQSQGVGLAVLYRRCVRVLSLWVG
jgi:hypothetical protein